MIRIPSVEIHPYAHALARTAHIKDLETFEHGNRMKEACRLFGDWLNLGGEETEKLAIAALLHDVGKSTLPDEILFKPGRLDAEEYRRMTEHTTSGHDMLRDLGHPWLDEAAAVALSHHERFDGSGYPQGTAGAAIPLHARVISVADVYDALRADRPYKQGLTHDAAVKLILRGDDRTVPAHFDPMVLAAFERGSEQVRGIYDTVGACA